MEWSLHRLEDLTEPDRPITYGVVKPGPEDPVNGVKFIRGGDIFEGKLAIESLRTITPEVSKSYSRTLLSGGELVVSLVGNPGHVAIVPKSLAGANLARQAGLVALRPEVDAVFVKYFLMSPGGRAELFSQMTGSVQVVINLANLRTVRVPLPPLPIQRRIAGILSAYDELIENSQRRIKILETMARSLYREWFVHFRYPGHENQRLVASPLGKIPEGWEVKTVKDVATVTYGFPFASKKFNTDGVGTPVIRIRDILDGSTNTFTDEEAEPKYHIKNGDILVGMDGDFHMCIWSSGHALQNQRVAKFESNGEIGNYHLFLALELPIQTWNKSIVGTTVSHLGDMHIKTIQIAWPPAKILVKATKILEPMSQQIIALKRQIQTLRRTRDLLLPRLLSGQVDVEESKA